MTAPAIYDVYGLSQTAAGYYHQPTLHGDQVVFVNEDDLWTVALSGGVARRISTDRGKISSPVFSPKGRFIAYTSTEEGCPEVFVMSAGGGTPRKLTYSGAMNTESFGWSRDGQSVLFRSNMREPFRRRLAAYRVPRQGGEIERHFVDYATNISFAPNEDGIALTRHGDDLARWKRYRGGRAGQLWVDAKGNGDWRRLLSEVTAGICRPMWIGDRIYFISDENGTGNLHSCTPSGDDFRQHTDHDGFYARFASHHENTIVYCRGGDLYRFDTTDETAEVIDIDTPSTRNHLKTSYADAAKYLQDYALHPQGHSLTIATRGKVFNFGNWEGAVRQTGKRHGVRYRLPHYLDDDRLLVVSDRGGEEHLEIHETAGERSPQTIDSGDINPGRIVELHLSPDGDRAIFANHRAQVIFLDIDGEHFEIIDESAAGFIEGLAWAPDGRHVAYGLPNDSSTSTIKIADVETGDTREVTSGEFFDTEPTFDPKGRYLYFLSRRHFAPILDQIHRNLSFPEAVKPCVVSLNDDVDSPFVQTPRSLHGGDNDSNGDEQRAEPLSIDFENIADRLEVFPVSEGVYRQIEATGDRVFWTAFSPDNESSFNEKPPGKLVCFDLEKNKEKTFSKKVLSFGLDGSQKTLVLSDGKGLRVVSAGGDGVDEDKKEPGRDSGLIDLKRVSVAIDRRAEWCQMLREAWRLMRDHFWNADMSGVDWDEVWDRYKELLPRVATRHEFSDLVWTMQGELGTSHAYEMGGDYETPPQYQPGLLGADFRWDPSWRLTSDDERFKGAIRLERILRGDPWDAEASSPLLRSGVQLKKGDVILAVNGQPVLCDTSMGELLTHQAGRQVELLVADGDGDSAPRTVTVKTLKNEQSLRYREWVNENRRVVHDATDGRVGYVHIPNMGLAGYGEFHRQYFSEHNRQAMIVDVRFNGGGFVSSLILEILARRPMGLNLKRHVDPQFARTYPPQRIDGPLVALTDAAAGSDGDIFSHAFKQAGLGPLIGQRTWGGTIGICRFDRLADKSFTTQPEAAFWFEDVGFGLENHGAEPDIEVPYPPETSPGKEDPQLSAAIEEIQKLMETTTRLDRQSIHPHGEHR